MSVNPYAEYFTPGYFMEGTFDLAVAAIQKGGVKEVFLYSLGREFMDRMDKLTEALERNSDLQRIYLRSGQGSQLNTASFITLLRALPRGFRVIDLYRVEFTDFDKEKIAEALDASSVEHLFLAISSEEAKSILSSMKRKGVTISSQTDKQTSAGAPTQVSQTSRV